MAGTITTFGHLSGKVLGSHVRPCLAPAAPHKLPLWSLKGYTYPFLLYARNLLGFSFTLSVSNILYTCFALLIFSSKLLNPLCSSKTCLIPLAYTWCMSTFFWPEPLNTSSTWVLTSDLLNNLFSSSFRNDSRSSEWKKHPCEGLFRGESGNSHTRIFWATAIGMDKAQRTTITKIGSPMCIMLTVCALYLHARKSLELKYKMSGRQFVFRLK